MKKCLLWIGAILLIVGSLPLILYSGEFSVEVSWSMLEKEAKDHIISVGEDQFVIPAGITAVHACRMRGGGQRSLLWEERGWRVEPREILVDGKRGSMCIRKFGQKGTLQILGVGASPSMSIQIEVLPDGYFGNRENLDRARPVCDLEQPFKKIYFIVE